jgi:hypothetical protein
MSDLPVTSNEDSSASSSASAPAARASPSEIQASVAALTSHPLLRALLDATDVSVVVLNRERQILVGNCTLLSGLEVDAMDKVLGLRPGEALGCMHARTCLGGCGSAPECSVCGAVLAILECQRTGATVERDCLMTVCRGGETHAQELRVRASRLALASEVFTIVGIRDVSAEKRRDALERVFLHDISNTVAPLLNWAHVLCAQAQGKAAELGRRIEALARRLQREIEDQRALIQAERGTLALDQADVDTAAALKRAAVMLDEEWAPKGRRVQVVDSLPLPAVRTDEALLLRVLVNMIKNALEATPEGGTVRVGAHEHRNGCELRVWNQGVIPPQVALQIFRRSFSTKPGGGRGLGTFGMKLFGERYLGGKVGFESTDEGGTTFFLRLPSGR